MTARQIRMTVRSAPSFCLVTAAVLSLFSSSSPFLIRSFCPATRNDRCRKTPIASFHGGLGIWWQQPRDSVASSLTISFATGGDCSVDVQTDDIYSVKDCKSVSTAQGRRQLVWQHLSECFQGDFDNYAQVVEDRKLGLSPREGGGHEHFHCTLVPLTEKTRLAAFFFDGNPDRIFRFRYYELISSPTNDEAVEMYLNTLHPDLERILKSQANDPLSWPSIFENFKPEVEDQPKVSLLNKCEISWSFEQDPVQHSYLTNAPEKDDEGLTTSLHAIMIHGPTIVNSTIVPGLQIRIIDQLSLYRNVFYINDRGFDPIKGGFIYGNQREVPYRLERVSTISSFSATKENGLRRQVENPGLEWTIGPDYRTAEEYKCKLQAIGGPTAGMNKNNIYKSDGPGK